MPESRQSRGSCPVPENAEGSSDSDQVSIAAWRHLGSISSFDEVVIDRGRHLLAISVTVSVAAHRQAQQSLFDLGHTFAPDWWVLLTVSPGSNKQLFSEPLGSWFDDGVSGVSDTDSLERNSKNRARSWSGWRAVSLTES